MNKQKWAGKIVSLTSSVLILKDLLFLIDWRFLEEVRDTASRPVYVYGAGKRVRFFKTKNGILKGPSLAIFGGAKGKIYLKGYYKEDKHIFWSKQALAL